MSHLRMDVAPWCYKCSDEMDESPGGVRYRAHYGANKVQLLVVVLGGGHGGVPQSHLDLNYRHGS